MISVKKMMIFDKFSKKNRLRRAPSPGDSLSGGQVSDGPLRGGLNRPKKPNFRYTNFHFHIPKSLVLWWKTGKDRRESHPLKVFDHKKIDAKPIFTVTDMMPNLASISGTVEMSVASIFLGLNPSACYWILFVGIILSRPRNSGSKLSLKLFF